MANTTGKKFGGRVKGTPNKNTTDLKNAILAAFKEAGGVEYLAGVAKANPAVFCQLLGRVLPMQVTGENGGPVVVSWQQSEG